MKKIFEVKYVKMDIEATDDSFSIKMPFGEMNQQQMKGLDSGPIRIENVPIPAPLLLLTKPQLFGYKAIQTISDPTAHLT